MEPLTFIHDIPFYQKQKYASNKALCANENGAWIKLGIEEVCDQIIRLSAGISAQYKGKNIGIYADYGSPYWNIVDFSIIKSGNVSVPIHGNASIEDVNHIVADARLEVIFVSGEDQLGQFPRHVKVCTL